MAIEKADIVKYFSIDDEGYILFNNNKISFVSGLLTDADIDTKINAYDVLIKDGVPTDGDTFLKLYNKIVSGFSQTTVANIAARDTLNISSLPAEVFVTDDGDGRWALYKALTTGTGATYVKISDPDLLNAAMSAAQIKTAYESNSDTNAFTNALLSKLNGIATGATANSTDAYLLSRTNHTGTQAATTITGLAAVATSGSKDDVGLSNVPNTDATQRANHTGTQLAATISDFFSNVLATLLTGLSTATNAAITATDSVLSALGKLQAQISANATAINSKQSTANKDASGGYVGLTLFKINFSNVANTFVSYFTNSNTASRTYTFADRNGTIADNTDITNAKNRTNHTGTQAASTITGLAAVATSGSKNDIGLGNVPNLDTTNPANITQSSSYRFASDTEKSTWNNKQSLLTFDTTPTVSSSNPVTSGGTAAAINSITGVSRYSLFFQSILQIQDYFKYAAAIKTIVLKSNVATYQYSLNGGTSWITPTLPLTANISIAADTIVYHKITFTSGQSTAIVYIELQ